jgi:hypothetical protein
LKVAELTLSSAANAKQWSFDCPVEPFPDEHSSTNHSSKIQASSHWGGGAPRGGAKDVDKVRAELHHGDKFRFGHRFFSGYGPEGLGSPRL